MSITRIDLERRETSSGGREYLCPNGEWYPSVTTIIGSTVDLSVWRKSVGEDEADRISKEACERGNLAHENIEKLIKLINIGKTNTSATVLLGIPSNNTIHDLDKSDPMIDAAAGLLDSYLLQTKEWHSEVRVWCPPPKGCKIGFAGTLDLLRGYKILGPKLTYMIHDFKSKDLDKLGKFKSKSYQAKALNNYWLQLAAYSAGVAHCFGILVEGGCIELLFPEGNYMSFARNKDFLYDRWIEFKDILKRYSNERS